MRTLSMWLGLLLVASCTREPRPHESSVLRVGTNIELTEPSPVEPAGIAPVIQSLLFRAPFRKVDEPPVPDLAAQWSFSSDGRVLTVELRSGLRFADGSPIASGDVVANLRRGMAATLWGAEQIQSVDALDELRFRLVPARPHLLPVLLMLGVGKADGNREVESGPYRVASRSATELVLAENPQCRDERARIPRIVYNRFDRTADLWGRLLAGDVDLVTLVPWSRYEVLRGVPSVREVTALLDAVIAIRFRRPPAPFDQPAVRRAISLAIDRNELVERALRGHGVPAVGPVYPQSPDFDAALAADAPDPAEALRRLAAAGIVRGADGLLQWEGRPLSLQVVFPEGHSEMEEMLLVVQRQLADIGLRLELEGRSASAAAECWSRSPSCVLASYEHAVSDLLTHEDFRDFDPPSVVGKPDRAVLFELQRRLREAPRNLYLAWPERLDVVDKRFCGLAHRPDGPESELYRVHPCEPGEKE